MNFEDMTIEEKVIWRSGQGIFVRGLEKDNCISDLSKNGWEYAKKVYANTEKSGRDNRNCIN